MSHWSLYLIRCADDTLYTGITTDVARRFADHQRGGARAAKYLRARQPLKLCLQVDIGERALALRAEYRVKQLSKADKEKLLQRQPDTETLLRQLGLELAD